MNTTYHEMPQEMYPVHLFVPEFETLGLWFPALDAWVLDVLCRKLGGDIKKLAILEIGTFVGGSASIFARYADTLTCVDTWNGSGKPGDEMSELYSKSDVYATFLRNRTRIERHNPHCTIMPACRTRLTLPIEPDERFDLIFIDGGHDYESVQADIEVSRLHLKPRGILCGHDFTMFDGVTKAVLDFGDEVGNIQACGTVWWKETT